MKLNNKEHFERAKLIKCYVNLLPLGSVHCCWTITTELYHQLCSQPWYGHDFKHTFRNTPLIDQEKLAN